MMAGGKIGKREIEKGRVQGGQQVTKRTAKPLAWFYHRGRVITLSGENVVLCAPLWFMVTSFKTIEEIACKDKLKEKMKCEKIKEEACLLPDNKCLSKKAERMLNHTPASLSHVFPITCNILICVDRNETGTCKSVLLWSSAGFFEFYLLPVSSSTVRTFTVSEIINAFVSCFIFSKTWG